MSAEVGLTLPLMLALMWALLLCQKLAPDATDCTRTLCSPE